MTIRGLAILVGVLLLAGCTAGSGRSDAPTTEGAITNIVVSGSGPSGIVTGGAAVNFVMSVTNNGPSAASNFNVFDNVGSGLTLTSITCVASGGAACPGTVGVLTAVQQLPAGGTLTFKVTANVGQLVSGTVSNQLSVDVTTNPNHAADSFVATVTVVSADLSVAATPPSGPLPGGSAASFTAIVTNNGPATSQNVTITNTLSSGVSAAGTFTCAGTGGAVCPASLGPTMVVPSIPVSGVLTFTIPFTVNRGTNGPVSDTMAVSAATDPRSGNNSATATVGAQSPDLSVSETGSAQVGAGSDAVFTAVVSNSSSSNASNVNVSYSLTGPAGNVATVTCTSSAGAICPATLGPVMTVPTLNAGRSLTFKFTVLVPFAALGQGAIVNTVAAAINGDPNLANNQASFSSIPINANNGPYELYAANGKKYVMTIDFDVGTYTISGNGQNLQASFSPDSAGGGYTVSGTTRFRVVPNLIVGGQDFGTGVLPYLAGRVFGTTVQQLGGVFGGLYNLVTLNIPASGPVVTHAGTAKASGNVMAICQSDTQVYVPQNCPAPSLHTYSLSASNNVYTGTDTITKQTYSFQLAIIGATVSLLSAGPAPDGSLQLRIGLPDSSAFAGRITQGASTTTHDWITMTLTANTYSFTSLLGDSDTAMLGPIISQTSGPFAMLVGNRASDGAQIFVMQSYPLSVAFGGFSGVASGLLQVTVP